VSILEVLIAGVVLGIAAIGIALMFSWGQTFVIAQGDDRVALYLAQQRIESLRASGFSFLVANLGNPPAEVLSAGAGGTQSFTRLTTVECFATDLSPNPCPNPIVTVRITVTVTPAMTQADPVTLQSFCSFAPGGC
jgi:hypothetical protein